MMTSPAAEARAKKLAEKADATTTADAAAAEVLSAAQKPKPRRQFAEMPIPQARPGRHSPAAKRRAFLIASSAKGVLAASGIALDLSATNDNGGIEGEAAQILMQLQEDTRRLKDISSIERKIAAKRLLLPNYEAWCAGVMAQVESQRGPLDEVFTTMMAWRIDTGEFIQALPMVEFAARNGLAMPDRFDRGVVAFAVEQISEAAIAWYDRPIEGEEPFPAAILPQLEDLIAELDVDLHDEISAKLYRALGQAVMDGVNEDDPEDLETRRRSQLKAFERAFKLNPKIGVKTQIDRLTKALNKPPAPDAGANDTPPAGG
ncbi:MAG: hypothetical protein EON96_02670 [Caulobacteraceae bacterium]|nr:MAG: hypothetical protein EON96_02670 [Caulobacteraceae bacterium]